MATLDKAPPDIQVQAHATLRARPDAPEVRHRPRASTPGSASIWGDGSAAQAKIADAYKSESEDQRAHKLGKALDAVGEAMFFAAEDKKKDKVDAIPFPVYKGPGTQGRHQEVHGQVADALGPARSTTAIEDVDKDYQKVTELQPVPPPRWVIAAASRAGMMWGNFVDDFRKAPYPKEWDKKGFVPGTGDTLSWNEVKATYLEHLDEASEPIKSDKAKPALKRCLDDSVKYQYFDEFSRDCEKWLAKNYKTEYHVVDELRGAPTLSNGGLDDKPPPLIIGGQLWHPVETGPSTEKVEVVRGLRQHEDRSRQAKKPGQGAEPGATRMIDDEEHGSILATGARAPPLGLGCGGGNADGWRRRAGGGRGGPGEDDARRAEGARAVQPGARCAQRARQGERLERPDLRRRREAVRGGGLGEQPSGKFPEATYDAGLAYQRCGNDKDAKAHFQQALADDPKFHYARAQLALYQFKADGNTDAAISALEQAVTDANFQNVPALVDLAMFQMQRDSEQVGANCHAKSGGKDVDLQDFDCAKLNLQRALAIDDGYMPAFNQLALYYFGSAKKKAAPGRKFGRTIATNAALGEAR